MKMTTRLSFLLLMAVSCIVILGRAQDASSTSTTLVRLHETGNFRQTSVPLPDSRNFLRSFWATDFTGYRRALTALPQKEETELFANIVGGKADDDILKMYYYVSALPLKERKAAFRNASSKNKSDLWRTHLALFLIKRPELNEWQKEIILTAMSLATPEYFEVRPNSTAWQTKVREPLRSLEEQIFVAFSFKDGAKIFATLGNDTEAAMLTPAHSGSVLLSSINYKQLSDSGPYKDRTFAGQDMFAGPPCECSTDSDWCSISSYCSGTNCSPTPSGCGTLWTYPCNGASCR